MFQSRYECSNATPVHPVAASPQGFAPESTRTCPAALRLPEASEFCRKRPGPPRTQSTDGMATNPQCATCLAQHGFAATGFLSHVQHFRFTKGYHLGLPARGTFFRRRCAHPKRPAGTSMTGLQPIGRVAQTYRFRCVRPAASQRAG
jgi:hypothetical protein